jgi:hypothetical protein
VIYFTPLQKSGPNAFGQPNGEQLERLADRLDASAPSALVSACGSVSRSGAKLFCFNATNRLHNETFTETEREGNDK